MLQLSETQQKLWDTDGFLHLEQVFDPDEVNFFIAEMDRIRQIPGFELNPDPELPMGHYP